MLTTASARPAPLPWLAAAIALIVSLVPFLISLIVLHRLSALSESARAMAYASAAGSAVFRVGLAFLIAQWHGERHEQLAFRRPALVLSLFGVFLLCWQGVQIGAAMALVRLTLSGASMQTMMIVSSLVYPLLHALGTWLAWMIAARIMRKDALPWPSFNARWRAAGLTAWSLASVLAMLAPMMMAALASSGIDSYTLAAAGYAGAVMIPVALAFAGAWLGLPRYMAGIHGWRWLIAAIGALISNALLAYVCFGFFVEVVLDTVAMTVLIGVFCALLCLGTYWVWTFALYTGLRRAAAR